MLTELCQELKNWFDVDRLFRTFTISNGHIDAPEILDGQYYRIVGSIFNDGVYQHNVDDSSLIDEEFDGAVWLLAIPKPIEQLASEIENWVRNYGEQVVNPFPFTSESFEGYSYSKGSGGGGSSSASVPTWKSVFADRLNRWRKL